MILFKTLKNQQWVATSSRP